MGISDITRVVRIAKDIVDLAKKGQTVDLQKKVIQFEQEAVNLESEITKYQEQIKGLEDALRFQASQENKIILATVVVVLTVVLFILAMIYGWDMGLPAGG